MCWVLYLAADRELPLVPWTEQSPAFNVQSLPEAERGVTVQFSKSHVYAVGAHTRCACGFDRGQATPDQPGELRASEVSLAALADYLRDAVRQAGSLELYSCWWGDQAATPDQRLRLGVEDFTPTMDWFPDRTFAVVDVSAGPGP